MTIAICDDEIEECRILRSYLDQYDSTLDAQEFHSAKQLLDVFENGGFFDLVFMDIEMEEPNGFVVAAKLAERPERPLVVFITNSTDYTIRGYGIAFRYLTKPLSYARFRDVVRLALDEIVPQRLVITSGGESMVLAVRDIYYFEVLKHEMTIHTGKGAYSCRLPLREIISMLSGTHFAQPHKSYYVNLAYLSGISGNHIIMRNGDSIPLSTPRKKQFSAQLDAYFRGK